jgi:hypothetical protein
LLEVFFSQLQRTQGWGTLSRGSLGQKGRATRPATGKVKVYFEAYKLDEVDRAVERIADGKARFRAVFVNAA